MADANGISDKNQQAANTGPLHIGQRLTIPSVASGQHHISGTHKVLNANEVIGNTSTTTPLPPTPPETPKKHNGLFAKIIVGVIAVVATVLTAGALGAAAGLAVNSLQTLIAAGTTVLGGAAGWGYAGTMAAGFAAGFVGNIASQGAATALKMQDGIDFKGALITGLATAATIRDGKDAQWKRGVSKVSL